MFPKKCPGCANNLKVEKLICDNCNTEIRGEYSLPLLMKLSESEQEFIIQFLLYSGSLKKMAKKYNAQFINMKGVSHVGMLYGEKYERVAKKVNKYLNKICK